MSTRLLVKGMDMLGILALLTVGTWGSVAMADGNPPVAEAIAHAESAADHGGQGHPDALVSHAEEALMHAQAAQKEVTNPHLDEGVHELMEAIKHGKKGHAEIGTEHANSAVMHMKEVH